MKLFFLWGDHIKESFFAQKQHFLGGGAEGLLQNVAQKNHNSMLFSCTFISRLLNRLQTQFTGTNQRCSNILFMTLFESEETVIYVTLIWIASYTIFFIKPPTNIQWKFLLHVHLLLIYPGEKEQLTRANSSQQKKNDEKKMPVID